MKKQMKTQECILCGEKYTPRCEKSYFCLSCYLNDYLPNKTIFRIDDFESGLYSLAKNRYYERFWGARPGTEEKTNSGEADSEIYKEAEKECTIKVVEEPHRIEFVKSVSPEHAHKRLVDAICSKITYI
ncbi:MAG: hypothetical protein ACP59X_16490 [Solidesulfovibrio sp. DCME]|uniref:hypothetical protein n=1 Tax=Solidesulfovibrio sp. DCME TaxID=3447380 RepID=UPI003D0E2270